MIYPVYIPTCGRPRVTSRFNTMALFDRHGVPFRLAVEAHEVEAYAATYGADRVLAMPFSKAGHATPARNWIKDHATSEGHRRYWMIDDDIAAIKTRVAGKPVDVNPRDAFDAVETFVDRYENVGIAGLASACYVTSRTVPVRVNVAVYSCVLATTAQPYRWRDNTCEDIDICLQLLSSGEWCTLSFNAYQLDMSAKAVLPGGYTDVRQGDRRVRIIRELMRRWPGVVGIARRHGEPREVVGHQWRKFSTALRHVAKD